MRMAADGDGGIDAVGGDAVECAVTGGAAADGEVGGGGLADG